MNSKELSHDMFLFFSYFNLLLSRHVGDLTYKQVLLYLRQAQRDGRDKLTAEFEMAVATAILDNNM